MKLHSHSLTHYREEDIGFFFLSLFLSQTGFLSLLTAPSSFISSPLSFFHCLQTAFTASRSWPGHFSGPLDSSAAAV